MDSKKKEIITSVAKSIYIKERSIYKKLALKIESIVEEVLENENIPYHLILCRPKTVDSYVYKITNDKYDDPVNQIFDMAGIRIITYVESEVDKVCDIIESIFKINKLESSDKSSELGVDKVGYKSIHFVCQLKNDRINLPEYKPFKNKYFEIQVRTILQHAWAEIEHDRNYKFSGILPSKIQRKFNLLAASIERMDGDFNQISIKIDEIKEDVAKGTKEGKLNISINSTTLKQYIKTKLPKIYNLDVEIDIISQEEQLSIITELKKFGITKLAHLDKIIPSDFDDAVNKYNLDYKTKIFGLLRMLLIIEDYDKYFTKCWNQEWKIWSHSDNDKKIFDHYNINWDEIDKKYSVNYTD